MKEFDIQTIDEEFARSESIRLSKENNDWKEADCKYIALSFEEGKKD
jgi:hypothetical protein